MARALWVVREAGGLSLEWAPQWRAPAPSRSEEHTSELQSQTSIAYAVFCLPPRHAHGDLTSLAPHERLPEILVVPREKTPTGAAVRGNP